MEKTAEDIMTKDVVTISPNDEIKKVVINMEKFGFKEIPVVDGKRLVGLITYYDILDFVKANPDTKVSAVMITPPSATPETSIRDIISLLLKSGIEAIPIVEKEQLKGIVSDFDVILHLLDNPKLNEVEVKEIMRPITNLLKEDDPISTARRIMRYHTIDRLPVVDQKGSCIGIVTSTDILRDFYTLPREKEGRKDVVGEQYSSLQMPIKNYIIKNIPPISPNDKVKDALNKLLEYKMKGSVVLDENKKVLGMFYRWDVLNKILNETQEEGVWLRFSGDPLDYEQIEYLKEYLASDVKRLKQILPDTNEIRIHIKKLHGTQNKWNYEINVKLVRASGRSESIKTKYAYVLMYALQDALDKLKEKIDKKYQKR